MKKDDQMGTNRSRDSEQDRNRDQNQNQNRNENSGNFANDPERAREAGRKGGMS